MSVLRIPRVTLVLVSSLFLVLPSGWCCWIDLAFAAPGEHAKRSCCAHKLPASPADGTPEPTRRDNCPCDQRQSTLLAKAHVDAPDLSSPVLTALIPAQCHLIHGRIVDFVRDVPIVSAQPPLHLVHCLWLC
jgi:hypothetical protein